MERPNGIRFSTSAFACSSDQMYFCVGVQSVPPYCFGQDGATQPFSARIRCQAM
jgi:hypothetical protein